MVRLGNVRYKQAEKTGCLKAGASLSLFSKSVCFFTIPLKSKTATIKLLMLLFFHFGNVCHQSIAHLHIGDYWETKERTSLQLVATETRRGKGLLSAT